MNGAYFVYSRVNAMNGTGTHYIARIICSELNECAYKEVKRTREAYEMYERNIRAPLLVLLYYYRGPFTHLNNWVY